MNKIKAEQIIREQVLDICKELFDNYIDSIQKHRGDVREVMPQVIPSAMIIAEFDSCTQSMNRIKNGYSSNEIVQAWRYADKSLVTIQIDKEPELQADRHKNFEETYVRYAFSVVERLLYLNIFYAPLNAKGYVYHMIEMDGSLSLSEAELEWLS